jgi:hypothetical protein
MPTTAARAHTAHSRVQEPMARRRHTKLMANAGLMDIANMIIRTTSIAPHATRAYSRSKRAARSKQNSRLRAQRHRI